MSSLISYTQSNLYLIISFVI